MKKKILSLLLALVMALSLVPTSVLAAPVDLGQARVIVENTTYSKDDGAPWDGTLVDTWVKLTEESTMMSCVAEALKAKGYTQTGAESNYISEINGLAAHDGGSQSGWMGTLNDWFANEGFDAFTVAAGKLEAGDEIRVMYTCAFGDDLGGSWGSSDNTVKALTFSAGELSPAFDKDTHSYTLKLAADVSSVVVTPTASNKNFQVRTSVDGTEYKRTAEIPVADGTVITVKCGDPSWPSMNGKPEKAEEYTITVEQAAPAAVKVMLRSQAAGSYLYAPQEVEVSALDAEKYGFTDEVEGVSALDALVKAHELAFGDAFTKEKAGEYLDVGSSGWISKIFGVETYACGFYVNGGYPNDGTPAYNGVGYNGTMVTNTPLLNGDVVDFYIMSDENRYSDYYTWVDAPAEMYVGQEVTATVTGFYAMEGYRYKTPAELKAAAKPLKGAKLGGVNPETGNVTVIDGAVTDKKGQATFTVADGFTGYLTAVNNEDAKVYALLNPTAKVKEVPVATLDLKGLHSAQLASLKLYTYTDGVKGDVDLLAGKSTVADGYKLKYADVKLPAGNYWVQGYNEAGQYNGGIVVTVTADTTAITFQRVYEIYATNSGWVENTDYTIDYQVVSADGMNRKAEPGTSTNWGTIRTSGIFVECDTVKATLTPIGDKAGKFNPLTVTKGPADTAPDKGALSINGSVPQALDITVTAPAGSTVRMGVFSNNYVYDIDEPVSVETKGDTLTANFHVSDISGNRFMRVQHPDGVTYWTFDKFKDGQSINVTKEDLHIGDASFTKDTVYRFEKNTYDLGNVYLNINSQGYLNLEQGQTRELDVFRSWQLTEGFMNAKIALPDVHYTVVDFNGQPSDVVTITPDENLSAQAVMKANKAGTAIVLVTYDAVTHMQGQTSNTANHGFSAIWPEFTGVFVVSVGADGSSIATNMTIDRMDATISKDEQKNLDAEFDTLFYLGDAGASYSFKPEDGCTVTVARSTVTDKMTFNGFTDSGVTVAADGTVTVTGLTTGRHIICVEKDGVKTYQVVTARGVSYDFLDADGNVLPAGTEFKAGDKVTIQFHGLTSAREKLARYYNFNFSLYYRGANGTFFRSNPGGGFGVYDFSGNPVRQKIEITIPEDWTDLSYDLTGAIKQGGFAGLPSHRDQSYGVPATGISGDESSGIFSALPALSLKLEGWHVNDVIEKIDAIGEVTLASEEAIVAARAAYEALTEAQQAQVTNYDKLTAAEARLAVLKPAKPVEKLIDAIGEVTLGSESDIAAARTAYDNLTEAQQAEVKNYDKLTAAEAAYARLLAEQSKRLQEIYQTTGDFMATLGTPTVNSTGGEWMVIGLARSGRTVPAGYYDNVVEYVKAMADANERLHRAKVTDNARVILGLTAIGKDVTNVGGHNLLKGLDNMAYVQKQGINGPIFTLIALDSHNYPTMGDVTREKLIQVILDAQLPGGGWTLSGTKADPDMTAMAIQALAPYYKTNETVKAAVDKALEALSALQRSDGGFGSWGTVNSESCAQVIVALTALDIDPTADSRFVKNGNTVLDALAGFYVTGGGFKHTADGERNGMATEQGYYALAAYFRFLNGQTSLYDMSDVTIQTDSHTHAFGAWTVTTPATCTADGVETRSCACGETETRIIPATGHAFGDWTVTTPATCTTDGVETRSCACGETETRIIPATGHVDADHDGKCDVCQAVITPVDPGKTDPSDPGKTDPTNPGTDTPATGDTGVLVWVIALPVALLAAAFVLKRKEREA